MPRRPIKGEAIEFNGYRYRRYPDSPHANLRRYFSRITSEQRCEYLHRAIWEHHNGPIPPGWHVHHKDEDTLNNEPSNLEALPASEHLSHHGETMSPERLEASRANMARIRPLAAAWHSSTEGLAWHSANGKASWASRKPVQHDCEQCDKAYETMKPGRGSRFCSNNCKSAWRRKAGIDDVDRSCSICGAAFRINRYDKRATCEGCRWRRTAA